MNFFWKTGLMIMSTGLLLTACTGNDSAADQNNENVSSETEDLEQTTDETLRFGTLPAESAIPIILAEENGYFEEENIAVELTMYSSPNDRNVAAQAGELDGMIGDVMTALSFKDSGMDMTITSDINEDFKLLSSPASGILNIQQLDGKEVSLVPNFILEYIMDEIAADQDLTYEIVSIPSIPARYEALMENQIDSVIFTEPQATTLEQNGAHLLASSAEYGIKGGTIQFDSTVAAERAGDIAAFYRAYNKAIVYINETDAAEYSEILADYQFPESMTDYLTNRSEPYTEAAEISQDQFDRIAEWTKEKGLIERDYLYDEATNFSLIKK